ncbi:MAG TPA: ORF6N domain-containing protein [Hanamia sp.]|nr:ORF6N domain-containing protein [Hanamia sp.]
MPDKRKLITQTIIENRIFTIRGMQVMIDADLAELYIVEIKVLNQSVKRNQSRFPKTFRFRLTNNEKDELVTNCDRFENLKHSSSLPYAFTEQGVAMLSAVLRSEIAIKISIQIMQAFVQMRKIISDHSNIFQRLTGLEYKQIETDKKFEMVFDALQQKESEPTQGIFYNWQIFDAYKFIADIIRKAQTSILLIDNYIDDTVLTLFCKSRKNVNVIIYTKNISKQLTLDLAKFNAQYEPVIIEEFKDAHDRFLVIDDKDLYHIGASLKDLGRKWFPFLRRIFH